GLGFLVLAWRVLQSRAGEDGGDGSLYRVVQGDKTARDLFAFSILYLAALFAACSATKTWEASLRAFVATLALRREIQAATATDRRPPTADSRPPTADH
ncbi:MAG TPA: hypothetical protein PLH39_11125, partial [Promineifilum sp.]|nr:hypothetical protein [Promineifilum sp.]